MNKKLNMKPIAELLKRSVFKNISNEGSLGKTTITLTEVGLLENVGIKSIKVACDHSRQDFVTAYGTRTKGELDEEQDPAKGVGFIDSRTDADKLINNLTKYNGSLIIEDHKADSLDEQNEIYPSARSYVRTYEDEDRVLWYFVPIGTADKSMDTIDVIANTFRGINRNDAVQFVFVINKGMMKAKGKKKEVDKVMAAYNSSESLKELKETGNVHEIIMEAQLSEGMISAIKNNPFSKFPELKKSNKLELFDYQIMMEHFENFEDQFFQIFQDYLDRHPVVVEE